MGTLWRAKSRSMNGQRGPDTHCGNVNPHGHMQVGAWQGGIGESASQGVRELEEMRRVQVNGANEKGAIAPDSLTP
jgi:hypothetical protein